MTPDVVGELTRIVDTTAAKLKTLDEKLVRAKPNPAKWSIAEILGHLIDSAANNHQRFVRAQILEAEEELFVFSGYEQDFWVSVQDYNGNGCPWPEVELWRHCNRHLARAIASIPEESLPVEYRVGSYEPYTLQYLVEDYVVHLKHHLGQIEEKAGVR